MGELVEIELNSVLEVTHRENQYNFKIIAFQFTWSGPGGDLEYSDEYQNLNIVIDYTDNPTVLLDETEGVAPISAISNYLLLLTAQYKDDSIDVVGQKFRNEYLIPVKNDSIEMLVGSLSVSAVFQNFYAPSIKNSESKIFDLSRILGKREGENIPGYKVEIMWINSQHDFHFFRKKLQTIYPKLDFVRSHYGLNGDLYLNLIHLPAD